MKACPSCLACILLSAELLSREIGCSSFQTRLAGRVHSPETCGINKDNAVWNNNSQFCDNRHECCRIQKKPR